MKSTVWATAVNLFEYLFGDTRTRTDECKPIEDAFGMFLLIIHICGVQCLNSWHPEAKVSI
jgi:hypothetical protein